MSTDEQKPSDALLPEGTQAEQDTRETPEREPSPVSRAENRNDVKRTARDTARFYVYAALIFSALLLVPALWRAVRVSAPAPTAAPRTQAPQTFSPAPVPTLKSSPVPTASPAPSESPAMIEEPPVFVRTAVLVDGKTVGVLASREAAEELLYDIKLHYEAIIEGEGARSSEFTAKVELVDAEEGAELVTLEELFERLVNGRRPLKVRTVLSQESTESIPFTEKTQRDDTLLKGLRIVVSLGREGERALTTRTIYENGKRIKQETGEETVTRESENRLELLGSLSQMDGEPGRGEGKKAKDAGELSFMAPAEGKVVSNFGRRDGGMHFGLDYAADKGDAVFASERGVVVSVLVRGGYGLTVEIDHGDGFLTRYAHLESALVKLGDAVEKGQQVATAGGEQYEEKGGFHFELRIDGFAYNPRYYLG